MLSRWRFWRRRGGERSARDISTPPPHHVAVTDIGRARKSNQDEAASVTVADGAVLLIVADGVGGAAGGGVASAATVQAVRAELTNGAGDDPPGALLRAIESANRRVRKLAAADDTRSQMASTVVAALVLDTAAWIASVGDSRAYVILEGRLRQVTADDSWVSEQVRTGLMTEHEAELSPYRNVITRGVGVEERADAGEIVRVALGPGDVVLVCSDGLYGMVSEAEIERVISGGQNLETAAHELVRLANEAGGADNISLALYQRPARAEHGD